MKKKMTKFRIPALKRWSSLVLTSILLAGVWLTGWSVQRQRSRLQGHLLDETVFAARSIPVSKLKRLSGTADDLETAPYLRLKQQLDALRRNLPDCRFAYLMGQRPVQHGDPESQTGITVFFYADSEPHESEDVSLPREIFFEAGDDEALLFATGYPRVFDPEPDRWGVWVSAYAPVIDPATGEVLALFGMDIDVRDWNLRLIQAAIPPIALTLFLLLVGGGGLMLLNRRDHNPPKEKSWLWNVEMILVLIGGLCITLYATFEVRRYETRSIRSRFDQLAQSHIERVEQPLRVLYELKLPGLARLFESSEEVDQQEFAHYVQLLSDHSVALDWAWVPVIPQGDRRAFEQGGIKIWEVGANGQHVAASSRMVHYPLVHVEPRALHKGGIGFDLGSCPIRLQAIEKALASGLATATEPVVLVTEDEEQHRSFLLMQSVRHPQAPDQPAGIVLTNIRLDQLLLPVRSTHSLHAELFLEREDGSFDLIDSTCPDKAVREKELTRTRPKTLFGKTFFIRVHPSSEFYFLVRQRMAWLTAVAGAMLSVSLAILVGMPLQQRRKLEWLVMERTVDLARSELDVEALAAQSRTFFWEMDRSGVFTKVSGSVREVLGYDPDQMVGQKSYCDLSVEGNREANREMLQPLLEGVERSSQFERSMITHDGKEIWTLSNIMSVRDASGHIIGLRGSDTDITERKRMDEERDRLFQEVSESRAILLSVVEDQKLVEETLRRQERLLSAASEAGRILLSGLEIETAVMDALAVIGEASGQDRVYVFEMHRDRSSGEPLVNQRHEWVRDGIGPQIDLEFLQNVPFMQIFPRWHERMVEGLPIEGAVEDFPEGERGFLQPQGIVSLFAVPLEVDGQFWGFIGLDNCREVVSWSEAERATLSTVAASIGIAITRQRAELELRESEARFQHLLERIDHIPVQGYDEERRVIYWNSASEEVYGYTRVEAMGRKIEDLIIPEVMRDEVQRGIDCWLSGGAPVPAGEIILRNKQGEDVPVYSSHILHQTTSGAKEIFCVDIDLRLLRSAEEALQMTAASNVALLEANPDLMFLFDSDGTIVDCHASDLSQLLMPREAFLNRSVRETLPPELAEETLRQIEKTKKTDKMQEYTYSLSVNGEERVFESRMVPCGTLFMSIVRDITQTRRMQDALEQRIVALTRPFSEPESLTLETLFDLEEIQRIQDEFAEATHVTAGITRPDGTPVTRPSRLTRLCGELIWGTEKGRANCYKSDAMLGQVNENGPVVHPCLSCGLWDAGVAIVVGGRHIGNWLIGQVRNETQDVESIRAYAREIGADEEAMAAAFAEVPMMTEEQFRRVAQVLYTLVKQLTDSAYMNMQQARFIAEERKRNHELIQLSTAIEQSPETVVITNDAGVIEYVNPAFERITGYSAEEAIGENARILKSGHHDQAFYARLWKTISSGEVWSGRVINRRKNGEIYTEEASISPVRDENRAITHYVAIKRDITAEMEQEELFRQSQKMEAVGQLAGGVAHDFNNILQAVLGFSEILVNQLPKETDEWRNANEIRRSAMRAADLVRQLLAFSRKQKTERKPVDLNQMVRDSEVLLDVLLPKRIDMHVVLDTNPCVIVGDAGQLTQVLMNLVLNARDAIPEDGRLSISTQCVTLRPEDMKAIPGSRPGSFVCLSVTDTGTGIDQDAMKHLFEPFFTTKPLGEGTGLGLAVIYGAVKQHEGWINVYSEPGHGSCFRIYVPRIEEQEPVGERPSEARSQRILLVEDDAGLCQMVVKMLKSAGYEPVATASAEEAMACLEATNESFDLLFSDIILPGKTGIELANGIREIQPEMRVLLYSGYRDHRERWSEIESKGYHFMEKPFTVSGLLATVDRALRGVLPKEKK